jgi:N-acetylglucosamine malate deacetylase 1
MPDRERAWNERREQWLRYLNAVVQAVDSGRSVPLGPSASPLTPPAVAAAQAAARVIFCAPHPDDESLSGALALRLRLDSGAEVTNVAVTLGRDLAQRARRLRELECACQALDFKLVVPFPPSGFDDVTVPNRDNRPEQWSAKVTALRQIFDRERPDAVFAPHAHDFNTTHVGTHALVIEALGSHIEKQNRRPVLVIETEFWHQIERPNLMLGLTPELVARQLVAIGEHGQEMARNPYHLLHPCRLMDNVRRGSEVVGGQGAAARDFTFAELYNVMFMDKSGVRPAKQGGCIIDPAAQLNLGWLASQFR